MDADHFLRIKRRNCVYWVAPNRKAVSFNLSVIFDCTLWIAPC
jgi:hypothetical protein